MGIPYNRQPRRHYCVLVRRSGCASHTCSFDAHVHPVSLCGGKSSWSCRDAWIMRRCIQCTVCTSVFYEQSSTLLLLDNSVFSCAIACSMYVFGRPLFSVCGHSDFIVIQDLTSLDTLSLSLSFVHALLCFTVTSLWIRMHLLSIFFRKSSAQIESSSSYIVGFLKYSTELERSMNVMGT